MQEIKRAKQERSAKNGSIVRELDISDEQSVFCPYCHGDNVELEDESSANFLTTEQCWRCKDCGQQFVVSQKTSLIWAVVASCGKS